MSDNVIQRAVLISTFPSPCSNIKEYLIYGCGVVIWATQFLNFD